MIATGFSGLRFLRQSHKNMTEEYVSVYGNYANKLLRLQLDLIQALDRHRRGHKQTVEVQHVHLHSGARGVVGIVNAAGFLRQSHKNMTEEYVSVYGNYANKLLRLQLDLIQALDPTSARSQADR